MKKNKHHSKTFSPVLANSGGTFWEVLEAVMTLLPLFRDYVCIQEMYLSATIQKSGLGVFNFILDLCGCEPLDFN